MDLDLNLPGPVPAHPAKTRRVDDDVKHVLSLVAKLSLSNDQQTRAMRAILLDCIKLPSDCEVAKAIMEATTKWHENIKEVPANQGRFEKHGLPHLHAWNSMVAWFKFTQQDHLIQASIKEYTAEFENLPLGERFLHLSDQVLHVRLAKNFDKDYRRLECNFKQNSPSERMYAMMKPFLLRIPDAHALPGIAPAGDIAKKLQQWLDDQTNR